MSVYLFVDALYDLVLQYQFVRQLLESPSLSFATRSKPASQVGDDEIRASFNLSHSDIRVCVFVPLLY